MSPEKAKLAKCLVKILNDNEDLSKEFNQKFNECIEQYTQCKNDKEKQSIVKQFSEWIISETNLKNELQDFEAELHISDESHNSSESDLSYDGNGGHKPPNPSDPNQPGEGKQEKALQKEPGDTEGNRELTHLVKLVQIKQHFKDLRAYNPNISEDNVLIEQAFYDKTLEALAFVVPNPVAEDGGGGNLTSDDKNTADKQQEGNTTEAKTDDKSEGDGYDAGMHLGGEVNNPFDINIIV